MSNLQENQREIFLVAYHRWKKAMESKEGQFKHKTRKEIIAKLDKKMRCFDINNDLDDLSEIALSSEANQFARKGQAKDKPEDFKKFLAIEEVKNMVEGLIQCKCSKKNNIDMHNSVIRYNIRKYIEENEFPYTRPKHITSRLVLMMFPELYTIIASKDILDDTCQKVGIDGGFMSKQRQLRCKIDKFVESEELTEEVDELGRATMAWFILNDNN